MCITYWLKKVDTVNTIKLVKNENCNNEIIEIKTKIPIITGASTAMPLITLKKEYQR